MRKWIAWGMTAMALGAAFLLGGCVSTPSSFTFSVHGASDDPSLSLVFGESEYPPRCLFEHNPFRSIYVTEYSPDGRPVATMWSVFQYGGGPVPNGMRYGVTPESYSASDPPYPLETGVVYEFIPGVYFTLIPNGNSVRIFRSNSVRETLNKRSNENSVFPDPPDETIFGAREEFSTDTVYKQFVRHQQYTNNFITLRWKIADSEAFGKRMVTLERGKTRIESSMHFAFRETRRIPQTEFEARQEEILQIFRDSFLSVMPPERFGIEIIDMELW